ncbi:MAG: MarR family winged helix-turn-helix transcriptional regulator [Acidimicrobiales bacterium]
MAISSGLITKLDARLRDDCDISFDDYEVLVHLSEATDSRLRMSDLSDRLLYSRSRLSQRVDRMADRDLVSRAKVEDDARGTWAVLTDHGLATIERCAPLHVEHVREHLFEHLDPEVVPDMAQAMQRLAITFLDGPLMPPQASSTDSLANR